MNRAARLSIPLPPLAEQRRVAALLNRADALRRRRYEALILADAFLRSAFVERFGDSGSNPKAIPTRPLREIMRVKSGEFLTQQSMAGGDIPVYGGNGVSGWHDKPLLDQPTVVIGRVGVYCGAVHETQGPAWVTDNALYVVEHADCVRLGFLAWLLRLANLNQYASQSAQPLVSGSRIYPVAVLVPDLEAQDAFLKLVRQVRKLRSRVEASEAAVSKLTESLSQSIFETGRVEHAV
jgi:type I restriction enzyme S subunit